MDVQSILNAFRPQTGSSASTALAADVPAEPAVQAAIAPRNDKAFREVVSRYDLTSISPHDFSELIQRLHEAGAITPADVQELAQIRLELEQSGADQHEPLDLVRFFQEKLQHLEKELRRQEEQQGAAIPRDVALRDVLRQIDWVQKLASVDSRARFESLDAVA
jgi:hypothetical protein